MPCDLMDRVHKSVTLQTRLIIIATYYTDKNLSF